MGQSQVGFGSYFALPNFFFFFNLVKIRSRKKIHEKNENKQKSEKQQKKGRGEKKYQFLIAGQIRGI